MTERQQLIINNVDAHKQMIADAERWLWEHPQTGYTEWEANAYMAEKFQEMGYELTMAGNIPGFYTDVETGKPGPKLCIMSELDALDISAHPESVNGMTHCCGHHAQGAAMLGIAAALKAPGALDGLCGTIRLMVVPAEEMIQLAFRENLRKEGVISYMGGKVEFMHRGFFDGIDLALMVHGTAAGEGEPFDFCCGLGNNGCMAKTIRFKGKSAHAGGAPHLGVNAQYAAMLGLQACNDLRETLQEKDTVRFHPIMMGVNCAVNIIPDEMKIESYVRGRTLEAMKRENKKFNRALTGAALAMGAGVELCDRPGYSPEVHDKAFMELVEQCCSDLVGKERVAFDYQAWSTGSSDFGDLTCVMPGVQFMAAGLTGVCHGIDFQVDDVDRLCVNAAKAQLFVTEALLADDAAKAKEIIANYKPEFASIKEYLEAIQELVLDKDAVVYDENGNATVDFQN
ncbi:MAG: amidohydrolase [Lachnospiraceae bacterium]|nr:amidohydrolase [Lachnospiraceae bacterium]MBQ1240974.1 amidohydrolase [Lachnospiraceae bacterium]MBQ2106001.1 amidohydrolase [Lachnospiraceae bacterium]MBQ2251037.1 amidohydrolase [Lachnospiraceae bacterium]MBQ2402104.1 amidohydrolase [Lachnospiraceae bacterium]